MRSTITGNYLTIVFYQGKANLEYNFYILQESEKKDMVQRLVAECNYNYLFIKVFMLIFNHITPGKAIAQLSQ